MKKIKKLFLGLGLGLVALFGVFGMSSCTKEDTIQHNLLKDTGNFKTYRKITVINLRSDKILMEFEGYLTTKLDSEKDVNIMIMTGPNTYQLHYVRLANEITYCCEQLDNTSTDPYHWKVTIYAILPEVEIG